MTTCRVRRPSNSFSCSSGSGAPIVSTNRIRLRSEGDQE
jgi:hypothetical protein